MVMMNPIKFRVWATHQMLSVRSMTWTDEGKLWEVTARPLKEGHRLHVLYPDHLSESLTLLQFTGVVDKSDVEIYEGDILRHVDGSLSLVVFDELLNSVTYVGEDAYPYSVSGGKMHGSEVIGNCYQNPELITWEME